MRSRSIHAMQCGCGRCAPPATRARFGSEFASLALGAALAAIAASASAVARATDVGGF